MMPLCRSLVQLLETADLSGMKHEEKLAFWINVHNVMMMHVTSFMPNISTSYSTFSTDGVQSEYLLLSGPYRIRDSTE